MRGLTTSRLAIGTSAPIAGLLLALGACSDSGPDRAAPPAEDGGSTAPTAEDGEAPIDDGGADVLDAGDPICSADNFCHSTVPAGRDLAAVWGDGHGIVWVASTTGDVLRWDGATWKHHTKVASGVTSMWGSGPTDVWIAAGGGLVHGEGASPAALAFAPVDLPGDPSVPIRSVWGTGPDDVWAAGGVTPTSFPPLPARGRVLHFSRDVDGGPAWTVDNDLSSRTVDFRGVFGSTGSGVWLYGTHAAPFTSPLAVVLRRRPGAVDWEVIDLPPDPNGGPLASARTMLTGGLSSDASVWYAGYTQGGAQALWHGTSADDGATFTWTFFARDYWERPIEAFWGTTPTETWAVGGSGLVSRWDGTSWKQAAIRVSSVPVGKTLRAIWGAGANDFWVVGEEIALHRTNAGKP